jgi:uncharacterized protein
MDTTIQNSSQLDVAGLLRGEERELSFDVLLTPELDVEGITVDTPTRMKGKAVNLSGYMELDAELTVEYHTHCSRCLTPVTRVMNHRITAPIAETLENMDNEEYIIPEAGKIDLAELARETFFLNVPMSHLCREDCLGLCPKCGADKNKKDCGCTLQEKDPRWKALEGFFDEE